MKMKTGLAAVLGFISGLPEGCVLPQSAYKLAGYTEPGVEIKRERDGEWSFKADSNFKGRAEVVKKTDGEYSLKINMVSDAAEVTDAQGRRAEALTALREIEAQRIVAQQQLLNELMGNLLQAALAAIPMLKTPPKAEPPAAPISLPLPMGPTQ